MITYIILNKLKSLKIFSINQQNHPLFPLLPLLFNYIVLLFPPLFINNMQTSGFLLHASLHIPEQAASG